MEKTYIVTDLGKKIIEYAETHGIEHMNEQEMRQVIEKIKRGELENGNN